MNNLPIQTYESVVQQRDALEKKLADMSAENAALNKFIKADCWIWDDKNETYFDACDGIPETPATDSFLAEVQAHGVDKLATFAGKEYQRFVGDKTLQRKWKGIVLLCTDFATQLRKEAGNA